jgi:hypothetical protein
MGNKEKLLDKAIRNTQGLSFDDFENLLSLFLSKYCLIFCQAKL